MASTWVGGARDSIAHAPKKIRQSASASLSLRDALSYDKLMSLAESSRHSSRLLDFAVEESHRSGDVEVVDAVSDILYDSLPELALHHYGDVVVGGLLRCGSPEQTRKVALRLVGDAQTLAILATSARGSRSLRSVVEIHGRDAEIMEPVVAHLEANFADVLACPHASYVCCAYLVEDEDEDADADDAAPRGDDPENAWPARPNPRLYDPLPLGSRRIKNLVLRNAAACLEAGRVHSYMLARALQGGGGGGGGGRARKRGGRRGRGDVGEFLSNSTSSWRLVEYLESDDVHEALLRTLVKEDPGGVARLYAIAERRRPPLRRAAGSRHLRQARLAAAGMRG